MIEQEIKLQRGMDTYTVTYSLALGLYSLPQELVLLIIFSPLVINCNHRKVMITNLASKYSLGNA